MCREQLKSDNFEIGCFKGTLYYILQCPFKYSYYIIELCYTNAEIHNVFLC